MKGTASFTGTPSGRPPALIVEPGLGEMLALVPALQVLGFDVTATESFQEAKQRLRTPPSLLITSIRLGAYNGLHLVLWGRAIRPDMAAIVLSDQPDVVLQDEAEKLRATFAVRPLSPDDLRASVTRTLFEGSVPRAPFERRIRDRRGVPSLVSASDRRRGDRRADPRAQLLTIN